MNETSRREGRPAYDTTRSIQAAAEREHDFDRQVVVAVHRYWRARRGRGYVFELPASLRRGAA